ncbi:hypothetical protein Q5P01_016533 [Channa striata]|uniref:Uncharacterized protein n=1 Tax=Channa striata TaxID=64152 RepID=A0AA88SE63_CHASR|nr:hypothetical protein Q5P01_016533 [Channa striata]
MASFETPPPTLRQGIRIVPSDNSVTVEEVLLAVGDQTGHDNLLFASRMNKAVVVFLKTEEDVNSLIESGVVIRDMFVQVSPLSAPSTRITVSGVPPFIPSELLANELRRFGKFASGFKTVSLGCKDPKLKHVQSLRRHVFMFLDSPAQTLEVSFRVKHGDGSYMVYASSGHMKCFECGDQQAVNGAERQPAAVSGDAATEAVAGPAADAAAGPTVGVGDDPVACTADESGNIAEKCDVPCDDNDRDVQIKSIEQQETNVVTEELSRSQKEENEAVSQSQSVDSIEAVAVTNSQITEVGEDMEYDTESDTLSVGDYSSRNADLYSLEEITDFLDDTFKKSVKVKDYFSDTDKFIRSAGILMKLVGFDLLDERKRFRLKKHITALNKLPKGKTAKKIKLSN